MSPTTIARASLCPNRTQSRVPRPCHHVPPGRRPARRRRSHPGRRRAASRGSGRLVLAEGEATGHAHAIAEPDAREFRVGDERFVLVRSAAQLIHEEHATIELAARRLPGRHPARVRAGADRLARLAPGGRLMSDETSRRPADDAERRPRSRADAAAARSIATDAPPIARRAERAIRPSIARGGKRAPDPLGRVARRRRLTSRSPRG